MSNVLLVSYLFPPNAGIGSPRALNYTRHLPAHGCRMFVLTARFATTHTTDSKLLRLVPPETRVFRAFNPEIPYAFRDRFWKKIAPPKLAADLASAQTNGAAPNPLKSLARTVIQRAACPDAQVLWAHFATRMALSIIPRHRIDTVLLNISPFSIMKIGVAIKRRFPEVRLISDIRDDWVGYYLPCFDSAASEYKRQYAVRLERELMECSDFVSAVTPAQRQAIRERYPDQPAEKFFCAFNGYSPELFADFTPRPHGSPGMLVTYFGSVYGNPVYSPKPYFDALDSLPGEIRDAIETRFIGRIAAEALPAFEGRRAALRRLGFMPQSEGIRRLEETDYLLLIARDRTTHAGKLFDYLATGKPILALTPPDGEIARIIRETRTGWVIDPEDPAALRQGILDAYHRFRGGTAVVTPDREAVEAFSWPNLVGRVAAYTGLGIHGR